MLSKNKIKYIRSLELKTQKNKFLWLKDINW